MSLGYLAGPSGNLWGPNRMRAHSISSLPVFSISSPLAPTAEIEASVYSYFPNMLHSPLVWGCLGMLFLASGDAFCHPTFSTSFTQFHSSEKFPHDPSTLCCLSSLVLLCSRCISGILALVAVIIFGVFIPVIRVTIFYSSVTFHFSHVQFVVCFSFLCLGIIF